jgi:hypothetical protein
MPKALKGGARTSRYIFDYAKTLQEKDKPAAVTAAIRHFYWYYTGCVYALSQSRKLSKKQSTGLLREARNDGPSVTARGGSDETVVPANTEGRSPADYMLLRKYMLALLRATVSDSDYSKYTESRFKLVVWMMLNAPGLFGAIWLCYRKFKKG